MTDFIANQNVTCRCDNETSPKLGDHVLAATTGAKTTLNSGNMCGLRELETSMKCDPEANIMCHSSLLDHT